MDTNINIADLIKPKFSAGQEVFYVERDHNRKLTGVWKRVISKITFMVSIASDRGVEKRETNLVYEFDRGHSSAFESQLVASINDLPEEDRKA